MPKPKPALDPILPTATITVHGVDYKMCLDLGALIDAEEYFQSKGIDVNLLQDLDKITAAKSRALFALGIHRFHPEIGFEEAKKLIASDLQALYKVAGEIPGLWERSMPQPKEGDKAAANPPEEAGATSE